MCSFFLWFPTAAGIVLAAASSVFDDAACLLRICPDEFMAKIARGETPSEREALRNMAFSTAFFVVVLLKTAFAVSVFVVIHMFSSDSPGTSSFVERFFLFLLYGIVVALARNSSSYSTSRASTEKKTSKGHAVAKKGRLFIRLLGCCAAPFFLSAPGLVALSSCILSLLLLGESERKTRPEYSLVAREMIRA